MAHWHDFNPWADVIKYVSLSDAASVIGKDYVSDILKDHGPMLDAYILKSPQWYSFGIRYGKDGNEYISPYVLDTNQQDILHKLYSAQGNT